MCSCSCSSRSSLYHHPTRQPKKTRASASQPQRRVKCELCVLVFLGARVLADLDVAGAELRPVHRLHRALRFGRLREPHRAVALGAALL